MSDCYYIYWGDHSVNYTMSNHWAVYLKLIYYISTVIEKLKIFKVKKEHMLSYSIYTIFKNMQK